MELNDYLNTYVEYRKKMKALHLAFFLLSWDSSTVAPKGCFEARGENVAVLSQMEYELTTAKEFTDAVAYLYDNRDKLDEITSHEIEVLKENVDKQLKIPVEEVMEAAKLFSVSNNIWVEAKQTNDFNKFKDCLEKIVAYERRYVKYLETDKLKGYDILLDEYERGMTTKEYDQFFDCLKEKLVPFVKKVLAKGNNFDDSFMKKKYPADKQKEVCEYFRDVMCFDKNKGIMMESEHPFTSGFGTDDVRITVHYYEKMFTSSIFSCIHETGHATYEANVDKKLNETFSGGGASMALHESQSRFYENIIGRDENFWKAHFNKLKEVYKTQLKDVDLNTFIREVNKVEASYVRTEADELTYPLHVMLRYDIEKKLISGELEVKDAPKEWNRLFKEYFGLKVKKDSEGILQDVHWSQGSFGYFPTYALGSAYGAQFLNAMKKDLDYEKEISKDNLKTINEWLREHIHKYGASKYPKEIIKIATGEDFNPNYYVDYLINKYSKIYNIK